MRRALFMLAGLALRRTLPPALVLAALGLLALAVLPGAELPATVVDADPSLGRMLARARVWSVTGLLACLVCVPRAAVLGNGARSVRGDLLAMSALPRAAEVVATWAGVVVAGALLLALGLLAAEATARAGGPARAQVATLPNPGLRVEGTAWTRWRLPEAAVRAGTPAGAELVVELVALPGADLDGPSTRVEVAPLDASGVGAGFTGTGRGRVILALPAGQQPLVLRVRGADAGARAVVPARSLRVVRPAPLGERSAGLRLATSGLFGLGAACALALALGTWLQAWIATLGVLALALLPSLTGIGPLPGARLGWMLAGEVPPGPGVLEGLVLLATTAAALALAAAARGRRRTA